MIPSRCKMYPKYRNKKVVVDGEKFDSKKEAARCMELQFLEKIGRIKNLKKQMKFQIVPPQKGERVRYYIADFVYEENGVQVIEDVKSAITKKNSTYTLKRALVKYLYPEYEFRET